MRSGRSLTDVADLEETLNPCGLVMDYVRSCYSTDMVFRTGDPTQPVTWYFADAGAKDFPFWSPFASSNWVTRVALAGALGEQPGLKPWINGAKPINGGTGNDFAVKCAEEIRTWWENGIPTGEETGPYYPDGQSVCCVDGPPVEFPCSDCSAVPDADLTIVFSSPDCDCLDGSSWNLTWNAFPGNWTINGIELCADCPLPNFGAIILSRILASEPCSLQLEGGQLFCNFDLGIITAEAICNGEGEFLFCTFDGTIGGGGPCDGAAFSATVTVT